MAINATGPRGGIQLSARGRYAVLLRHSDSTDVAIRLLAMTLVTFSRVPQELCPAALRSIQYVDPLPNEDHCSTLHCSSAAPIVQTCAVVSAPSASALTHAVLMAKSAVLAPRVRILICLLSSGH